MGLALSDQELSIEDAVDLAIQYHQAGQLAEAESIYRQVLQVDPRHADALHYLGVISHQQEDPETAVELISKAIQTAPDNASYHSNLGEAFRALGRFDEATAAYEKALAIDPGFAMAHNNLANVLADSGRKDDALTRYDKAAALLPDDPEIRLNRANLLMELSRSLEAVEAYRNLIEEFPQFPVVWNGLGLALEALENLEDARQSYEKAQDLAPDYEDARVNLERVQWSIQQADLAAADQSRANGDWGAAAPIYQKILDRQPDNAVACFGLGVCRLERDDESGAIELLERAVRIQPFFEDAHAALGTALLNTKEAESARAERQIPAAQTAIAIAHFRAERFAQAEHAAEQAVDVLFDTLSNESEDNEAWTLLGLALRTIRDVGRSESLLRARLTELGL